MSEFFVVVEFQGLLFSLEMPERYFYFYHQFKFGKSC